MIAQTASQRLLAYAAELGYVTDPTDLNKTKAPKKKPDLPISLKTSLTTGCAWLDGSGERTAMFYHEIKEPTGLRTRYLIERTTEVQVIKHGLMVNPRGCFNLTGVEPSAGDFAVFDTLTIDGHEAVIAVALGDWDTMLKLFYTTDAVLLTTAMCETAHRAPSLPLEISRRKREINKALQARYQKTLDQQRIDQTASDGLTLAYVFQCQGIAHDAHFTVVCTNGQTYESTGFPELIQSLCSLARAPYHTRSYIVLCGSAVVATYEPVVGWNAL